MSYRTFKHLLGETSLERKCRFIFSGVILTLISFSFVVYGIKTERLVLDQRTQIARILVRSMGQRKVHVQITPSPLEDIVAEVSGDRTSLNRNSDYELQVIDPRFPKPPDTSNPDTPFLIGALTRFLQRADHSVGKAVGFRKPFTYPDGSPTEEWTIVSSRKKFQYAQAVLFQPSCLVTGCHASLTRDNGRGKYGYPKQDDLAVMIAVTLPMDETYRQLNYNRALLISTALVTALMSMAASYVIVRYVIVKPVKHLRVVSDAIAAGRLNIRSQIQTGDEFEELSHAFNRMLHNLVAMQQELREVNADLDKKVDELAQANMALFEMNRLKSDFLATMSHELRTPLNSIIGFSEVLSDNRELSDKQRRYAQNIQTSGKMLLGMINDILDLAKIESGKMEFHIEDFSIRDVCEGLVNLMKPMADRKDLDLDCSLHEAIPLLRQDPGKIRQIIYNLLSNAIKFTPGGGRVSLSARAEGRFVIIEVEDTGIGIAAEDRDRIFEKFRQVHSAGGGKSASVLTREHQGTGLGLSIVRELSRLLGGDVHLESQVGQGSTFTVRIPMQLAANRKFEVNLAEQGIDLSKARRVEPRPAAVLVPHPSTENIVPQRVATGEPHPDRPTQPLS